MKIGDNVLVQDIYEDHPAHRNPDTDEYPDEDEIAELKNLIGSVGSITNKWRCLGMEAHDVYQVEFPNGEEVTFCREEIEGTLDQVCNLLPPLPKKVIVEEGYKPLSAFVKEQATELFKYAFQSSTAKDKFSFRCKSTIDDCIEMASELEYRLELNWKFNRGN